MSFIFISNLVSFEGELPFKLTNKYTLERAIPEQVKSINMALNLNLPRGGGVVPPYAMDMKTGAKRSEKDWLYWVLNYDGPNIDDYVLSRALVLLKVGLLTHFSFVQFDDSHAPVWHPQSLLQYFADGPRYSETAPTVVDTQVLLRVQQYVDWIEAAEKQAGAPIFALNEFMDLRNLPSGSNLQIIGCFAAIESLITHNPELAAKKISPTGQPVKESPSRHSLNHQLKTKLPLLERFFERTLDYSGFGSTKGQVWKELYGFRSAIAHGSKIDFATDYPALISRDLAFAFVREVTKLVILVSLEKPEFIEDLRAV